MFVKISTLPDTKTEQFMSDLIDNSEEPLISSLKSIDLRKEKIKSPENLVTLILTSKDQIKYPEELVFKAIAKLIASKNIPADTIKSHHPAGGANRLWILWIILGISAVFFFIIWNRRKNKEKN